MRVSAGLLLYRIDNGLEVLLAHPGGPRFARKDHGHWTVPKGEPDPGETDLEAVALREFTEEIGPAARLADHRMPLGTIRQKGGKLVHCWAVRGDVDPGEVISNTFTMEWPPGSGRRSEYPEIDRAEWFTIIEAAERIKPTQEPFLSRLAAALQPRPLD